MQDDWKVSRNLTLNIGLRLGDAHGATEVNGIISNLDLTCKDSTGAAGPGPLGCFTLGKPTNDTHLNWGPRFGFAWSPGGSSKTVVRGGYAARSARLSIATCEIPWFSNGASECKGN